MNREQSKRTILIAGIGTSPAVLTEIFHEVQKSHLSAKQAKKGTL